MTRKIIRIEVLENKETGYAQTEVYTADGTIHIYPQGVKRDIEDVMWIAQSDFVKIRHGFNAFQLVETPTYRVKVFGFNRH
ncbi:MAG: hypothetical protein MJ168_08190 [Clostridia bacterium]|nr:hypothetical protein [Clostridia bacterium]